MYSVNCTPTLVIGKQGENNAEQISVDFAPWLTEYGEGVISARLKRPKDSAAYPVVLTTDGTTATWTVSATDTQYAGAGSLQLVYIVGDVVAKSVIWPVRVLPSLEEGEAPEPYESWLDTLEGLAADTQENARDAADSAADAAQSAQDAAASAQAAADSAASITGLTAVAETLPEGSEASASFDASTDTLTLGIPKGDTGATGPAGPAGPKGDTGADGFSPTITVTEITGGHEVSVTDAEGTQTFNVMDGVSPVLDDEVTEDSVNGVKSSGIYDAIVNLLPTDMASGSIASFPDGADDVPMLSLKAEIEPVQEGSGTPSPDNVRPISGWTEVVTQRTGKNLFNKESIKNIISEHDYQNGAYYCDYIELAPNTTVTVSFNAGATSTSIILLNNVEQVNGSGYIDLRPSSGSKTFTTDASGRLYIGCLLSETDANFNARIEACNIQIELGSTATAYEPYQGTTYPISWQTEAGTVYGGSDEIVSGQLKSEMGIVDLGDLNWRYDSGGYFQAVFSDDAKHYTSSETANAICSSYAVTSVLEATSRNGYFGIYYYASGGKNYIRIHDEAYTDATAFKTAISGQTLVYKLATPITYHLTPQEVRTFLGQNNIWNDVGDTEVTYRADIGKYIEKKVTS